MCLTPVRSLPGSRCPNGSQMMRGAELSEQVLYKIRSGSEPDVGTHPSFALLDLWKEEPQPVRVYNGTSLKVPPNFDTHYNRKGSPTMQVVQSLNRPLFGKECDAGLTKRSDNFEVQPLLHIRHLLKLYLRINESTAAGSHPHTRG